MTTEWVNDSLVKSQCLFPKDAVWETFHLPLQVHSPSWSPNPHPSRLTYGPTTASRFFSFSFHLTVRVSVYCNRTVCDRVGCISIKHLLHAVSLFGFHKFPPSPCSFLLRIWKGSLVLPATVIALLLIGFLNSAFMRNAGLHEAQGGINIAGRNINNLRFADDTILMAESEELKSFLMKVKRRVKK